MLQGDAQSHELENGNDSTLQLYLSEGTHFYNSPPGPIKRVLSDGGRANLGPASVQFTLPAIVYRLRSQFPFGLDVAW